MAMPPAIPAYRRRSRLSAAWRVLRKAPLSAWVGLIVVAIYILLAVFAPLVAPFGEGEVVSPRPFEPWGDTFLLGTDQIGRDMFSRLIYGARNSIGIAVLTTALSFLIGGSLGILCALLRGWLDLALSAIVDVLMAIPQLVFALILLAVTGPSILALIAVIGVLDATRVFRLARATATAVTVADYVEAARLRGEPLTWIVRREILPNIMSPLVAEFGLRFCYVFLTMSALSFLGLGIQPPTADWGSMVRDTATLISYGDITPLLPAAAIALLTVSVNFVVDWFLHLTSGLRDEK